MSARCLVCIAFVLFLAPVQRCAADCIETVIEVGRNGEALQAYVCHAMSPWRYASALVAPVKVTLTCFTAKVRSSS